MLICCKTTQKGGEHPKNRELFDMEYKEIVSVCNIASVKGGKRLPKGSSLITTPNAHPYIRIRDLQGKNLQITKDYQYVDDETQKTISKYIVNTGDVVLSIVGTIGLVGIVGDSLNNANLTENCVKLIDIDESKVDREYLYYYLISSTGQGEIKKGTVGAAQPKLPIKNIQSIKVPLFSLPEQRKISELLRIFDDKIELNNKINSNLLEQAIAIFNKSIQSSNSVTYTELGALADIKGGKRLPKGINLITVPNSHPYIRVQNLNNTVFASLSPDYEYVDDETQKTISRYITSTGDVLISIVGTIGLTAIVDDTLNNANFTENCVKITNLHTITPEYLLLYLRSNAGVEAIARGTVGAVQLKLPIKNIQTIMIPILPASEIQLLGNTLSSIFSKISANVLESKKLHEIRDTLLPKLISGELDVSEINL